MIDYAILAGMTAAAALVTALAALAVMRLAADTRAERPALPEAEGAIFVFDDDTLIDATAAARRLLADAPPGGDDRARLVARLAPRFPDLAAQLDALPQAGIVTLRDRSDTPLMLEAQWRAGLIRLTLTSAHDAAAAGAGDQAQLDVMAQELDDLRHTVTEAPVLIWREAAGGSVTWANRLYLTQAGAGASLSWPLPRLFAHFDAAEGVPARCRPVDAAAASSGWFDCTRTRLPDGDALCYAVPVSDTVRAEESLCAFRQTLARTFAHMPVGIAVFDRQRRLQMFNPALTDLTGLQPGFLSGQPSLSALLDRLREARILPEPRDYKSWRHRIADLDQAAANGDFEETWTIPGGQTYRVIGKPHPDGAIALMLTDISSEMSMTRSFRAELEIGHAVLDSFDEAIAVFSPGRVLVMSNAAYARLWGVDPAVSPGEVTLADALALWQGACASGGFWTALDAFLDTAESARAPGAGEIVLRDGRRLAGRFAPLVGGAVLVGFRHTGAARPASRAAPELSHARPG